MKSQSRKFDIRPFQKVKNSCLMASKWLYL